MRFIDKLDLEVSGSCFQRTRTVVDDFGNEVVVPRRVADVCAMCIEIKAVVGAYAPDASFDPVSSRCNDSG